MHVDGNWFAPHEPALPADDRGFLFGDAVFESLRARGGVPVRLEAHLDRLAASAAAASCGSAMAAMRSTSRW